MDDLHEKVAVITGVTSGVSLAFTHRFATAGVHLTIADIETPALDSTLVALHAAGVEAIGVRCDVPDAKSMQEMATEVCDPPAMEGRLGDIRFAYLESEGPLKTTLEIVDRPPDSEPITPDY